MLLTTAHPAPPRYIAELDFIHDASIALRDEFYTACAAFRYRETVALSRALNIHPRTVQSWRYKERMPNWYIANLIIDWVKQGKPMRQVPYNEGKGIML